MVYSSDESDSDNRHAVPDTAGSTSSFTSAWEMPAGNQRHVIAFTEIPGLQPNLRASMTNKFPTDFYSLLVPDEVFKLVVDATNQFAIDKITEQEASRGARIRRWSPTNIEEMRSFFALEIFMGLVKLPKMSDY